MSAGLQLDKPNERHWQETGGCKRVTHLPLSLCLQQQLHIFAASCWTAMSLWLQLPPSDLCLWSTATYLFPLSLPWRQLLAIANVWAASLSTGFSALLSHRQPIPMLNSLCSTPRVIYFSFLNLKKYYISFVFKKKKKKKFFLYAPEEF